MELPVCKLYVYQTRIGPFFIAYSRERFRVVHDAETLGSFASPEEAARHIAFRRGFAVPGGIDPESHPRDRPPTSPALKSAGRNAHGGGTRVGVEGSLPQGGVDLPVVFRRLQQLARFGAVGGADQAVLFHQVNEVRGAAVANT